MELQEVWIEAKPHVKGIATVVMEKVVLASLEKIVADSENKFDDGMYAMLKPLLMEEMKKQIEQI